MFLIIMFLISKLYGIPKRQQNVLDMKLHYIYGMALATSVQLDQVKHLLLEVWIWHGWMDPHKAFTYWVLGFVIENLGKGSVCTISILLLLSAKQPFRS